MVAEQVPARVDINAYAGDDFALTVSVTIGGIPADLTGASALMQLKASAKSVDPIISLTSPSNGISFPTTSTIKIALTAAQTSFYSGARMFYDLQITDSLGLVRTYIFGDFIIKPDTSR